MTAFGRIVFAILAVLVALGLAASLLLLHGCASPVIVQSDTKTEQKAAVDAAKDLEDVRKRNATVLPAQDQAVVIVAEKQLTGCADIEARKDVQVKTISNQLAECRKAEQSSMHWDWYHPFESLGRFWYMFLRDIIELAVAFAIGTFFGRTLISMAWAAIKVALHLA